MRTPFHSLRIIVVVIVACGVQACIIPPDLSVAPIDTQYKAVCHCETCTQYNPNTMACEALASSDTDLFECGQAIDVDSSESYVLPKFEENCEALEMPGTTCGLALIDDQHIQSDFVVVTGSDVCRMDTSNVARSGVPTPFWSQATVTSGTMEIRSPDGNGTTNVTGQIQFIGGNCTSGSCAFRIVFVTLQASAFSLAGENVSAGFLVNTTLAEGTFFPGPGLFVIPAGGLQVLASGTVAGSRRGLVASSVAPGVGLMNQATRRLVFSQQLEAGDTDVNINISASIDNLPPTASLPAMAQVECSAPGGASVSLPLHATDSDGRVSHIHWYVDGQLVAQDVETLNQFIPLGTHVVDVWTFDNDGGPATATTTLTVADTTPPEIAFDRFCLWPPHHELLLVTADTVALSDVCDPSATVVFTAGQSNQPDDGGAAGNTSNDIVVNPDSVCVRAERSGMVIEGRQYTVSATIQDAAANVEQVTLFIRVPHDRSESCNVLPSEPVTAEDSRCVPHNSLSPAHYSPGDAEPDVQRDLGDSKDTGGCSSARSNSLTLVFAVVLLCRRRRRRVHA